MQESFDFLRVDINSTHYITMKVPGPRTLRLCGQHVTRLGFADPPTPELE